MHLFSPLKGSETFHTLPSTSSVISDYLIHTRLWADGTANSLPFSLLSDSVPRPGKPFCFIFLF